MEDVGGHGGHGGHIGRRLAEWWVAPRTGRHVPIQLYTYLEK